MSDVTISRIKALKNNMKLFLLLFILLLLSASYCNEKENPPEKVAQLETVHIVFNAPPKIEEKCKPAVCDYKNGVIPSEDGCECVTCEGREDYVLLTDIGCVELNETEIELRRRAKKVRK